MHGSREVGRRMMWGKGEQQKAALKLRPKELPLANKRAISVEGEVEDAEVARRECDAHQFKQDSDFMTQPHSSLTLPPA